MTDTEVQVPEEQQEGVPDLVNLLKDFDGSPGQTDIEKWKQQHGEIFVSGFSESELFVWRPLTRAEYVSFQKQMRAPQEEGREPMSDLDFEDVVVNQCILWGSDMNTLKNKGGSVSILSEQIMTNSNFMAPAMASVLVMKL